jgi:putative ABC transport system permease protein
VKQIIPFLYFAKVGNHRVIGTDETFLHRPDPSDTPILSQGKWAEGTGEVVLGSSVARELRIHPGDEVKATVWTGEISTETPLVVTLKVSGVFAPSESAWDEALFSNLDQARKALEASHLDNRSIWKANVLNYFLVYLDQDDFPKLESLINKRTVAEVIRVGEETRRLQELTGQGRTLGFFLCVLILFLGGLSVAAMMATRFDAMSVQLAVLRALGYARGEIRSWLLWEGFLLGIFACLLGGLADALFFPVLRGFFGSALPPSTLVSSPLTQSLPVWITALIATSLAVFVPLLRLYRQDVHRSLKGM